MKMLNEPTTQSGRRRVVAMFATIRSCLSNVTHSVKGRRLGRRDIGESEVRAFGMCGDSLEDVQLDVF
jgi:hypothetical protein